MKSRSNILLISILIIIISSACVFGSIAKSKQDESTGYQPREYISEAGVALPGEETRIELEDGAAIVIPGKAIDEPVSLTVERNPEKSKALPPLGDEVIPLGDFYNFEVTEGEILGPVDLILPIDPTIIPEELGIMVYAYPENGDWKFIPVVPENDKVTMYTEDVGDPIILWHFLDDDELDYVPKFCDPDLAVFVSPGTGTDETEFRVWGKASGPRKDMVDYISGWIWGEKVDSGVAYAPVRIVFNNNVNTLVNLKADPDGNFEYTFKNYQDVLFKEGINRVNVEVECGGLVSDRFTSFSTGSATFGFEKSVKTETKIEETQVEVVEDDDPLVEPEPVAIPEGAIQLPDFTGWTLDDSVDWLEENGFRYTWIDGSSTYDLGMIYDQAPAAGQYKVPHRTTVVLYRTTTKMEDPYGCANPELTSEERANCGENYWKIEFSDNSAYNYESRMEIYFSDNSVTFGSYEPRTFFKSKTNTYEGYALHPGSNYWVITFTSTGFITEVFTKDGDYHRTSTHVLIR